MKIQVLGCSGGLGPRGKTTSFLVDEVLLIDAGSGLDQLSVEQMLRIENVLITHAHIDHILGLPLMLGTIYEVHRQPVKVFAIPEVLEALRQHVFNWTIWPDFSCLPKDQPILEFHAVVLGNEYRVGEYQVAPLPAVHPTPAVGFWIEGHEGGSFAFTGDSSFYLPFWQQVNVLRPQLVIADVSFTAGSTDLAADSGHMTTDQLNQVFAALDYEPVIRATHFKVGQEERLTQSVTQAGNLGSVAWVRPLRQGEVYHVEATGLRCIAPRGC